MFKIRAALLLAIAMATPTTMAAWSVAGSFEPDTQQDIDSGMFHWEIDTNPSEGVKRVYLNVFPVDREGSGLADVNPNTGATKSRFLPAPQLGMAAYMGVWKDCNNDGYIGMAEGAIMDYSSSLIDGSICPDGGFFNHDGWVSEFHAIVPGLQDETQDWPRAIHDPEARIWGDFGRPGVKDEIHFDCAQAPMQSGSADSTGGLLLYFDCQLSYNVARTITENDPTGQLAFDGDGGYYHPERDCDNPLNQHLDTYGNDYCRPDDTGLIDSNTSRPAAVVWDCDGYQESYTDVKDPTNGQLHSVTVPADGTLLEEDETVELTDDENNFVRARNPAALAPGVRDGLDGSVYDVYNSARDPTCAANDSNNGPGETLLSASFAGTNPADGKQMADFNLTYNGFGRGNSSGILGTLNPEDVFAQDDLPDGTLPGRLPNDAGVFVPGWDVYDYSSGVTYLPPTYMGPTIRTNDLTPAGGIWFTFYAALGPATQAAGISLPGGSGVYGSEACGTVFSGIQDGWDCDPANWWKNYDIGRAGQHEEDPSPGDSYVIRDMDCYDGVLVDGVPVYASLASLDSKDGPCVTPSS